jgi:ATP-dependent DNA ligase
VVAVKSTQSKDLCIVEGEIMEDIIVAYDCIVLNGANVTDLPYKERLKTLKEYDV